MLRSHPLTTLTLSSLLALGACKKAEPPPRAAPAVAEEAPSSTVASPGTLGAVVAPPDNPSTEAKIRLGHQLFFDKRLSVDGSLACYSCHQNEDGNGGHEPLAVGTGGKTLPRHSPVIWNVAYYKAFYWDGRSSSLEAQAAAAWAGGMGVGKDNLDKKAAELAAIPGYKAAFEAAFPGETVTAAQVTRALAAYERTLICDDTAYDRHARGDDSALTADQKAGLALFMGKAGCVACHAPPLFSSAQGVEGGVYFNTGIGTQGKPEADVDVGRMAVTKADSDWAAFKPPSLRNVSKSAPYFHDGSVATLAEAVRFMASGGHANKARSPLLIDRKLTDGELASLVAFLGALDCNKTLEAPSLPQ